MSLTLEYFTRLFKPLRESPYPRGTPASGLLRSGVDPGNTLADPGKARKIMSERAEKYRKIYQNSVREHPRSLQNRSGTLPERARANKTQKNNFRPQDMSCFFFAGVGFEAIWGPGREPKIARKRARGRQSASGDGAGSDLCRFFLPVPFGVALRTDFWRVRPSFRVARATWSKTRVGLATPFNPRCQCVLPRQHI